MNGPINEGQELAERLGRPLFNIDRYADNVSNQELMTPFYRKCYRVNSEGRLIALNLEECRISENTFATEKWTHSGED